MKYLITESQLDKSVFKYLNSQDFEISKIGASTYFKHPNDDEFEEMLKRVSTLEAALDDDGEIEIDYDQILIVDADTIIHPDAPDIFKLTDHKYCLVHDDGDFDWILRSMENYHHHLFQDQPMFNCFEYYNSGFQIVNKTHREFFTTMREFYTQNSDTILWCQKTYGVGTDQTPLNYLLRRENVDVKALSYKFNMSCMFAKEIVNDQLQHTEAGYVMHFNGIPDKDVSVPYWMEKTYKYLYD